MYTTQKLGKDTLERVRKHGKMGESFDRAIDRLLDEVDKIKDRVDAHDDELDDLHDQVKEDEDDSDED